LLNSPLVVAQAAALAERSAPAAATAATETLESTPEQRISRMFQLALGRLPSADEIRSAKAFVAAGGRWVDFAQVMLLSNEFIFVD
jgi:hypothetical protein